MIHEYVHRKIEIIGIKKKKKWTKYVTIIRLKFDLFMVKSMVSPIFIADIIITEKIESKDEKKGERRGEGMIWKHHLACLVSRSTHGEKGRGGRESGIVGWKKGPGR